MTSWSARLAVLAVFLVGCVAGAAAMHLYRLRLERELLRDEAPLARLVVLHLDRELDLTAEQEAHVREVVMEIRTETIREMQRDLTPRIVHVMDVGRARIDPILTDAQRARLEEMYRERRAILERGG